MTLAIMTPQYGVKDANEASFGEMLAAVNGDNQEKLYAQTNAQDDTLLQFVDSDTQAEMSAVDKDFVNNAGGLNVDGENLVQTQWVAGDVEMNANEQDQLIADIQTKKAKAGQATINDYDGMSFAQTLEHVNKMWGGLKIFKI